MTDFPNEGSFWNLLNVGTMGSESTSNSQFPGFSSQAPMTPEQQAFLQSQQQVFLAFQQTFQNIQQNPLQQQSQSSNSISQQTDSQPKRTRVKHVAKRSKGKEAEPTGDVTTLRWSYGQRGSVTCQSGSLAVSEIVAAVGRVTSEGHILEIGFE
ncbi:hypothetical protein Tco_0276683 [Tanacetum coccineum]